MEKNELYSINFPLNWFLEKNMTRKCIVTKAVLWFSSCRETCFDVRIACVFVETGNFNGSEIKLDFDGNINETAYPLVMISTSDFPLSKSSGYVKAPYVQTNSNRFPLTVVERK